MNFPTANRRRFLKATSGLLVLGPVADALAVAPTSETLAQQLYGTLSEEQRKTPSFDFDDPLRHKVDNSWRITKSTLAKTYTKDQQDLVRQIFRELHSPEYQKSVFEATDYDQEGEGFEGGTSAAFFGTPGTGKFEFVLTGRHVTRRCDGDSVEGAAFGGPIFYGHSVEENEAADHPGNIYWYQAKRANAVFAALDGKQREKALIARGKPERQTETVKLSGKKEGLEGLSLAEMTADQRGLVDAVLTDLLAPFRKKDADEALKLVRAGGMENLHLAFSKADDVGGDGIWDTWQIEGPDMRWYFRGAPHVHCWVHVRAPGGK